MTETLRKTVFWLSAVLTTGFGLVLLVAPGALAEAYGSASTDDIVALSRIVGAVTLAFSVLAVLAVNVDGMNARRAIDATFLTGYVLLAATVVWNTYQFGTRGADVIVWSTLGIYVIFAAAFGYLLVGKDMAMGTTRARPT